MNDIPMEGEAAAPPPPRDVFAGSPRGSTDDPHHHGYHQSGAGAPSGSRLRARAPADITISIPPQTISVTRPRMDDEPPSSASEGPDEEAKREAARSASWRELAVMETDKTDELRSNGLMTPIEPKGQRPSRMRKTSQFFKKKSEADDPSSPSSPSEPVQTRAELSNQKDTAPSYAVPGTQSNMDALAHLASFNHPDDSLQVRRYASHDSSAANLGQSWEPGDGRHLSPRGGEEGGGHARENASTGSLLSLDSNLDGLGLETGARKTAVALGNILCTDVVVENVDEEMCITLSFKYRIQYMWTVSRTILKAKHWVKKLKLEYRLMQNKARRRHINLFHETVSNLRKISKEKTAEEIGKSGLILIASTIKNCMQYFLSNPRLSREPMVLEFIEISWLSFSSNRSQKYQEGHIYKRRGGNKYRKGACWGDNVRPFNCVGGACRRCCYQRRWMLILDDAVCYADKNDRRMKLRMVLWFDVKTTVKAGIEETGTVGGLVVKTQYRTLTMEVESNAEALKWKESILDALGKSYAFKRYRFQSLAPERHAASCRLLVDGHDYLDTLYEELDKAMCFIYITDWWITPTMTLRRGATKTEESLVQILKRKAEQGVQIRISIFKEIPAFLYLESKHAMNMLKSAHHNIHVQRHPDHGVMSLGSKRGVIYWSHHEKMVCIDHQISFIGGIDLCLGRYDNHYHGLTDHVKPHIFPGKEYGNPVYKDYYDITRPEIDILDRETTPRMPWHDIHCMVRDPEFCRDMSKHFMQLWNHTLTDMNKSKNTDLRYLTLDAKAPIYAQGTPNSKALWNEGPKNFASSVANKIHGAGDRMKRRFGSFQHLTTTNAGVPGDIYDDDAYAAKPKINYLRRISSFSGSKTISTTNDPHAHEEISRKKNKSASEVDGDRGISTDDLGVEVQLSRINELPEAERPRRHLSQRTNASAQSDDTHMKKLKLGNAKGIFGIKSRINLLLRTGKDTKGKIELCSDPVPACEISPLVSNCSIQFVRSSSRWSNGTATDSSIHTAYIALIAEARNYIYIENQFFMTSTHRGPNPYGIKNRIGEALVKKIEEKHAAGEMFKVYINVPLMPAFEANDLMSEEVWSCRLTMFLQYQAIIDGPNSIIGSLRTSLGSHTAWEKYIIFTCLRTVDRMPNGVVFGNQIYIHSKLMIVDDEKVILGSSNINDRSMVGHRDSEIACVISSKLFAESARTRLWHEHFNVLDEPTNLKQKTVREILSNPASQQCWDFWIWQAVNTERVYEEKVFAWPVNNIKTWGDWHENNKKRDAQVSNTTPEEWAAILAEIKQQTLGCRICLFPFSFLLAEDIRLPRPASALLAAVKIFS